MKKNLLLTCLLTLIAALGMAQVKATFPITLTEADGLPGPFVVQNYLFKSETYQVDKPVQKIRMTVCNTNTANNVGYGSHDGISAYQASGQPFFTMSEVRIFDENGVAVDYVAYANSVDPGDGGGLAALSDNNEGTYLHTNYGGRCLEMPFEYHYVEFELAKEVSTFYFTIQTRSKYYKNLITYMGITAGSADATEEELAYVPFPEQELVIGEQVKSISEFEEEGKFFIMQGSAQDYPMSYEYTISGEPYVVEWVTPGNLYMRSPYEGTITPSAASVIYLIPDADGTPDTYRVRWLNSGRYIATHQGGLDIWTHFTRELSQAAALTVSPCDTASGFYFTIPGQATVKNEETGENETHKFTAYLGYDCQGRMDYIADSDSAFEKTSRPHAYNWTVYNASINGAAIVSTLQAEIDLAEERMAEIGEIPEEFSDGEYEALQMGIKVAKRKAADPNVAAGDIVTLTSEIRNLTTAYAIASLWVYADTINKIEEMVDNGEIVTIEAPNWTPGAFLESTVYELLDYMSVIEEVVGKCETISDVDKAVENLYSAVDDFWARKLPEDLKTSELPIRIGQEEDGLPGENISSEWIWRSKTYYFEEEIDAIRMTVFKNYSNRNDNYGKPFICLNEIEFYDAAGVKIPMTADNYAPLNDSGEGLGVAGLCDGQHGTDKGVHFHSKWGSGSDGEYFYIDITFPEAIYGFSYKQWGRGNSYPDTPTDFVFGFQGETIVPEDVPFPAKEDPYGTALGEMIASVDEITDEGFYAIVGNWGATPEGNYQSNPIFFTGLKSYGPVYQGAGAPCVYRITKSVENDSTYNIFSLATNKYIANNGGPGNYYTGENDSLKYAAQVRIVPAAPLREELGAEELENPTFFIYQYRDTMMKEVDEYVEDLDTTIKVKKPYPYLMLDSWGGESGASLVWRAMYGPAEFAETNNDGVLKYFFGELEWNIYKMTMAKPNLYWLQAIYEQAAANEMIVGTNPGYYTEASVGEFANALAQAQAALESNDDATAAAAISALQASLHLPKTAERHPVVAGTYVIESAMPEYVANQGSPKVLCSYFNRWQLWGDSGYSASSDYTMWWTYAPEDYFNCHDRYKFQLVPAVITEDAPEGAIYSELLAQWYTVDSTVTEKQLATAFFIKSVETGQYVYVPEIVDAETGIPSNSVDFGFTDTPETPYIFLEQGAYKFNIWSPYSPNKCFHLLDHGNGGGTASSVCLWNGDGVAASQFKLYRIDGGTDGINNVPDAEGEVVSVSYYTADGAAVAAPVKGINIVKKTYANGVVKTTKEFVK